MPNKYYKIYNENSGPLELCHWCYRLTKVFYFGIKKSADDITWLPPSYFLKIYEKGPCLVHCFFSVIRNVLIYLMISYEALVDVTGMT